jgi:hypothetical protein
MTVLQAPGGACPKKLSLIRVFLVFLLLSVCLLLCFLPLLFLLFLPFVDLFIFPTNPLIIRTGKVAFFLSVSSTTTTSLGLL